MSGMTDDITVHVFYGPDHEFVEWNDKNNPNNEPVLTYRHGSTTGNRRIPDGWVLGTGDGDEWIVGSWEIDGADDAVAKAKDYLRQMRSD